MLLLTARFHQNSLGQNFVESWTYSACLSIVDDCQRWVDGDLVDKTTSASFLAVKAELLELARKQVSSGTRGWLQFVLTRAPTSSTRLASAQGTFLSYIPFR